MIAANGNRSVSARYDNDMYQQLVSLDTVPHMRTPHQAPNVTLGIEDDNTLTLDEQVMVVSGHKLFVFNALLMHRHRGITKNDLDALGFAAQSSDRYRHKLFSATQAELRRELISASTGNSILLQRFPARAATYQLDPKLAYTFYDRRAES